ncbi:MAG: hypothetical protein HQK91_06900 [Nitrospirae bacterium]|nr:hypothetical protein [Nitrospirota bacterium]MBF0541161.1 hypothetical protein [Nitrospirota bacterium]
MSLRKNLSSIVVFSSVFLGSIIGEGINIITTPNSIRDLFRKLNGNFDVVRETVKEKTDDATIMLIEKSTVAITKTKMRMDSVSTIVQKYKSKTEKKENIDTEIAKIDSKTETSDSIPALPHIDTQPTQIPTESEPILEVKPKTRKKSTASIKTESTKNNVKKKKPAAKKSISTDSTDKA